MTAIPASPAVFAADEAQPMPHRLLQIPIAPIFAVFGFVTTGICTIVGATVDHGHALYATAADAPVNTGWYGGLLMALVGAIVSVYQGWRQTKRAQDTEDRAVWRAELMQADQDRAELKATVKLLTQKLDEMNRKVDSTHKIVEHTDKNVGHVKSLNNDLQETIVEKVLENSERIDKTERKVARLGGDDIPVTPVPGEVKLPPEVIR